MTGDELESVLAEIDFHQDRTEAVLDKLESLPRWRMLRRYRLFLSAARSHVKANALLDALHTCDTVEP